MNSAPGRPYIGRAGLLGLDLCTWFRYPAPVSFLCFCVLFCFRVFDLLKPARYP